MLGIRDALKRVYAGEDALVKHITLFVLTGIPAMLATPLNDISKQPDLKLTTVLYALLTLLVVAVAALYVEGYYFGVLHNSFDEKKYQILPEFDTSWFNIFFKALPVQLAWLVYLAIVGIAGLGVMFVLSAIPGADAGILISTLLMGILMFLIFIMLPFILARFAKNYERTGLYNPLLPFEDLYKTYKSVAMLILKLIPIILAVLIVRALGSGSSVFAYIFAALGAYVGVIMQYVIGFCYVQILKAKIEG